MLPDISPQKGIDSYLFYICKKKENKCYKSTFYYGYIFGTRLNKMYCNVDKNLISLKNRNLCQCTLELYKGCFRQPKFKNT